MSKNNQKPKRRENTHYSRALNYLQTHGHINNHIAVYEMEPRNFDLASTIKTLRRDGYNIETIRVDGTSAFPPFKKYRAGDYVLITDDTEVVDNIDDAWSKVKSYFNLK
tara:strand:+ start:234 stop:560 length:327 start_codon:yes stop_codon:yes gene_type:complete